MIKVSGEWVLTSLEILAAGDKTPVEVSTDCQLFVRLWLLDKGMENRHTMGDGDDFVFL